MSAPSSSSNVNTDTAAPAAVYERLHSFDWSRAPDFQAGIDSITIPLRNAGRSEAEVREVVKRAQVFYFGQQTGEKVTPEGYTAWLNARGEGTSNAQASIPVPASIAPPVLDADPASSQAAAAVEADNDDDEREPYPASFDAIAELIATGRVDQIPGIRDIPLEISDEPPSEAKLAPRPKPWEQTGAAASNTGSGEETSETAALAPVSAPAGFESVSEIMHQ
ncbi:hypothetical protein CF327_g6648 [Tilletia walkeri]|uniref:Uncharacterized protein n=1 Tax=Tilletia walkeri TaxID=117179 RepID=A0A8X7N7J8_9BASI|nr:hypothetical protein CF327_g6648 [Tilletia walkeri]KAE8267135.1 hypothetical protein A4X09_0g5209 [Tilletia walkeri]